MAGMEGGGKRDNRNGIDGIGFGFGEPEEEMAKALHGELGMEMEIEMKPLHERERNAGLRVFEEGESET